MTTSSQPGWYDDPQNSNAQRYWDGQNWTPHRQRKPAGPPPPLPPPPPLTTAPPPPTLPPPPPPPRAAAPTPQDQLGAFIDKVRPAAAKGPQFWSGLSRNSQIGLAAAGLAVTVLVFALGAHVFHSSGSGDAGSDQSSQSSQADKTSQSYQMGLEAGTKGQAEIEAFGGFNILTRQNTAPAPFKQACKDQFNLENGGGSSTLVERDYMAGCLDGLNSQSEQWKQSRKAKGGT